LQTTNYNKLMNFLLHYLARHRKKNGKMLHHNRAALRRELEYSILPRINEVTTIQLTCIQLIRPALLG